MPNSISSGWILFVAAGLVWFGYAVERDEADIKARRRPISLLDLRTRPSLYQDHWQLEQFRFCDEYLCWNNEFDWDVWIPIYPSIRPVAPEHDELREVLILTVKSKAQLNDLLSRDALNVKTCQWRTVDPDHRVVDLKQHHYPTLNPRKIRLLTWEAPEETDPRVLYAFGGLAFAVWLAIQIAPSFRSSYDPDWPDD